MRPPRAPGASRLSAKRSTSRVQGANQPYAPPQHAQASTVPSFSHAAAPPPTPIVKTADIRAPWAPASLLFNFEEWSAAQHLVEDDLFSCGMEIDGVDAPAPAPPAAQPQPRPAAAAAAALAPSASSSYEARLERDACAAVSSDQRASSDPARLALLLSRAGHDAFVRRSLGNAGKRRPAAGGSGGDGGSGGGGGGDAVLPAPAAPPLHSRAIFETLSHAFVVVRPPREPESLLVVDAGFRDAVAVVSPPPRLARVLDSLPRVFVGGAAKLDAAVRLVASETRRSLEAEGRPVPPWRSARALLSKWMPQGVRAVVDERPRSEEEEEEEEENNAAAACSSTGPPTSPTCAADAAGCCSPFSSNDRSLSTTPEGACVVASSSNVPPTALGSGSSNKPSTPPIALVAPPVVARLSVSLLSSSLARVSASASSAAATAAKATAAVAAAVDEMRPVRRATWAPAA